MVKYILFFTLLVMSSLIRAQEVIEHTVTSGETLKSIANKYNITESELKKANSGLGNYLLPGMILSIPSNAVPEGKEERSILDLKDDLKDVIFMKDGSELVAKISSINSDSIYFEQYDTDDLFSIPISKVISITYEDGSTKNFPEPKPKKTKKATTTIKRRT